MWIEPDKLINRMCELYGPIQTITSIHQKTEVKFRNLPNFKMIEEMLNSTSTITLFKE